MIYFHNFMNKSYLIMTDSRAYNSMAKSCNPYEDGNASSHIVKAILENFYK